MQDYPFHPLCEQYDLWPQDTLEEAVADLKKNGFDPKHPVYTYEGKIVIGRNRFIACQRAEVEPVVRELKLRKGETLEEVISRDNDIRRHDPVEQQKRRRKERVQRIVAARAEGQSTRTIAENEGVSQTQVQQDLRHVTEQGGCSVTSTDENTANQVGSRTTPPSGKVTGINGRMQTATPAKPDPLTCEGCKRKKRVGQKPAKKCPDCKKLRDAAKLAKEVESAKNEPEEEPEEPATVEEEIKSQNSALEKFARGLDAYLASVPDDPWLHDLDRWKMALSKAKAITETIRSAKCYKPCPLCKGEKCVKCHKTGRVTKYAYQQMV